jgi:ferric-dicitrate binding protein FerR (iron transport regulator)
MNASIGRPVVVPGNIFIADSVKTEIYTAWKDGRLIIEDEPLEELAVKLERKFDVRIEFKNDKIRDYKFTGILENETLEQVLYAMQLSSHIKYRIDKKTVYLESLN